MRFCKLLILLRGNQGDREDESGGPRPFLQPLESGTYNFRSSRKMIKRKFSVGCGHYPNIRFLFAFHSFLAYAHNMEVGGYNKEPDWVKIGPSLLVAASLVLAIPHSKVGCQ